MQLTITLNSLCFWTFFFLQCSYYFCINFKKKKILRHNLSLKFVNRTYNLKTATHFHLPFTYQLLGMFWNTNCYFDTNKLHCSFDLRRGHTLYISINNREYAFCNIYLIDGRSFSTYFDKTLYGISVCLKTGNPRTDKCTHNF